MTDWRSGPLPFARAVSVWCAAAGVAGAYYPQELEHLARQLSPRPDGLNLEFPSDSPQFPGLSALERLHEEAQWRAQWRSEYEQQVFDWPDIAPRGCDIVDGRLVWVTSVVTALYPHPEGWEVAIEGEHVTRWEAAESCLAAQKERPEA